MRKKTVSILIIVAAHAAIAQEPLDDQTPPTPAPIVFPAPPPACGKIVNLAKASNLVASVASSVVAKPGRVSSMSIATVLDASNKLDGAVVTIRARLNRVTFLSLWDSVTNQFTMIPAAAGRTCESIRYAETNAIGAGSLTVRFRK
ncbi:MAG: hypothetical protein IT577_23675 [Verrucomicrobiae bacterium]|nr:hypothetical protein [Verrucomicrobiae bacterium]